MDLKLMQAEPTGAERAAVDELLGPTEQRMGRRARAHRSRPPRLPGRRRSTRRPRTCCCRRCTPCRGRVGWISPGGMNYVCERLTVPPAEAYGVATFYAMFSTEERPPTVLHVCDDIACRLRGAGELVERLAAGRVDRRSAPQPVPRALRARARAPGAAGRRSDGGSRRSPRVTSVVEEMRRPSRARDWHGARRAPLAATRIRRPPAPAAGRGGRPIARSTTTGRTAGTRRCGSRSSTDRSGRSARSPTRS